MESDRSFEFFGSKCPESFMKIHDKYTHGVVYSHWNICQICSRIDIFMAPRPFLKLKNGRGDPKKNLNCHHLTNQRSSKRTKLDISCIHDPGDQLTYHTLTERWSTTSWGQLVFNPSWVWLTVGWLFRSGSNHWDRGQGSIPWSKGELLGKNAGNNTGRRNCRE